MLTSSHGHFSGKSLPEWLCYLETIHNIEIDLGLQRIAQVAARLAIDLSFARIITVAGTNGKGTTCAFLERALLAEQHTVAVYSSPHINRFNERLRLNLVDVSDQQLITAFEQVQHARAEISLTYYEFTTLAAFLVLMQARPQVIILEVGLGGRLDATNIIDADIAVVTTVDLDHQAFLGADREAIGKEKAGIFRANRPAVVGDSQPPASVLACAQLASAELYLKGQAFSLEKIATTWHWHSAQQSLCDLTTGFIPMENVATALMVLELLGITLTSVKVNQWLEHTQVAGRMEFFNTHCQVLLDVAHNPQAASYLATKIQEYGTHQPKTRIFAVLGMMADKDIYHSLQPLLPYVAHWFVSNLSVARAAKAERLEQELSRLAQDNDQACPTINCFDNVTQAFKMANQTAKASDLILVFGSFYTVAEIRTLLVN
jgi:dihydrofolate synthase / folylpolyglutamate synthase